MDKYELVLDIIEHPDNYTSRELAEIMADPETREIYDLLCKVDSAVEINKEIDIDKEWSDFSRKAGFRRRHFFMRGSRAASIIAIICTSIVAMAVGVAVTVAVTDHKAEKPSTTKVERVSSLTESSPADSTPGTEPTDTGSSHLSPILFEDAPLSVIMERICDNYGVEFKFGNEEVAGLHLYYKFDPSLELEEVVSQLNTFESINITKEDNLLTID